MSVVLDKICWILHHIYSDSDTVQILNVRIWTQVIHLISDESLRSDSPWNYFAINDPYSAKLLLVLGLMLLFYLPSS